MSVGRKLWRGVSAPPRGLWLVLGWPLRALGRAAGAGGRGFARVIGGGALDQQQLRRRNHTLTVLVWVAALICSAIAFGTAQVSYEVPLGLAPFIGAAVGLPVLLIRHRPATGWSLSLTGAVLLPVMLPTTDIIPWPWQVIHGLVLFALLFAVCAKEQTGRGLGAWLLTIAVYWGGVPWEQAPGWAVGISVVAVLGLLAGRLARTNRELARQEQVSIAEREARVVLEERTRIARDLHDIVAHHMSLVVVQAETAPYRVADLSDAARAELQSISTSARSALAETRALLAVLRQAGDAAEHAPQPGIGELEPLLDGARRAGVPLTAELHVPPETLRPGTSLAAYRIVQEALANAARHAAGAPVRVELVPEAGAVRVSVVNGPAPGYEPGTPVPAPREGHGLTGMRERVGAEGGTLWAGPTSDGGFTVWATLPVAPAAEAAPGAAPGTRPGTVPATMVVEGVEGPAT